MMKTHGKIVVIGAGIAGLCTAVYAAKCGYDVEVLEQHEAPGGLATSWRRGEYTFENCLQWLLGSRPGGMLHAQWQEIFDIESLQFVDLDEYARVETEHGESLRIYTDVDRLEAELLKASPQDAHEIHRLVMAVRSLASVELPDPTASWPHMILGFLRALPALPSLRWLSELSVEEYGRRLEHPLLKAFFSTGDTPELSLLAIAFALTWMNQHNAGYPLGGSQAVIQPIVSELQKLGGRLRTNAAVTKILVENDAATGVQLSGGETIAANWVVSAADGHSTIYDLLGGRYTDESIEKTYATVTTFPSYVHVALGVARDLSQQGPFVVRVLDTPVTVDPATSLSQLSFRFFNYDPGFAPPGKTAVTCFLPTRNFEYWEALQQRDPSQYQAEKDRIAQSVVDVLEKAIAGIRSAIEVVDVATPATVIRYTRNWKGSYEGWLPTAAAGFNRFSNTLPGLQNFMMTGQWVSTGGGLPTGLMTARHAVKEICTHDRVPFMLVPSR